MVPSGRLVSGDAPEEAPLIEQRRYARVPIDTPAFYWLKGSEERRTCLAKDISLGGMFVETDLAPSFNAEIQIQIMLPGGDNPVVLPGVVRWVRDGGMGVQFGNLGAKETHLITEIGRAAGPPSSRRR